MKPEIHYKKVPVMKNNTSNETLTWVAGFINIYIYIYVLRGIKYNMHHNLYLTHLFCTNTHLRKLAYSTCSYHSTTIIIPCNASIFLKRKIIVWVEFDFQIFFIIINWVVIPWFNKIFNFHIRSFILRSSYIFIRFQHVFTFISSN